MWKKFANGVTTFNQKVFTGAAFLVYPLFLCVSFEVVKRYVFKAPTTWAYDLTWIIFGIFAFLGLANGLAKGVHVKADIIMELVSDKARHIITVICYVIFFFPMMGGCCYSFINYIQKAIQLNEQSPYTIWSPVIWPCKVILGFSMLMLLAQGIVEFGNEIGRLAHPEEKKDGKDGDK